MTTAAATPSKPRSPRKPKPVGPPPTDAATLAALDTSGVYILHYERPYKHARHYIGWAQCIGRRITEHAQGKGARFTRAVHDAGIAFQVAGIIPGATRSDERRLHDRHATARFCPLCRAQKRVESPKRP